MALTLRLASAALHYDADRKVHTATSGPIGALEALYLILERDDEPLGAAEIRANIAYLTGVAPTRLIDEVRALACTIDWHDDPEALLSRKTGDADHSAPARALVDCLLHDWASRRAGQPLVEWLGGQRAPGWPTNQSLFWCDDATLEARARDYVARGFRSLKLRVAVADFEDDYRRLVHLRELFGGDIELAIDANGRWSPEAARRNLQRLEGLDIAYVEQPLDAEEWAALEALTKASPIPLMLDESIKGTRDIDILLAFERPPAVHLKLVKTGGIGPLIRAAEQLAEGGVEVMVGQMNEGALATSAAVHCAMLLRPRYAELYGADGLVDDPCGSLVYRRGEVALPDAPGLGPIPSRRATRKIWEITS